MIKIYVEHNLWALDQDVLNLFYTKYIKAIHDYRYNYMPICKDEVNIPKINEAIMVHFTVKKPWKEYDADCGHELWFSYAKKLDNYEDILYESVKCSGEFIKGLWKRIDANNQ